MNDILGYRAKAALQRCHHTAYESGNKCGKVLARAVRDAKTQTYIPHMRTPNGSKVSLPNQISQVFRDYYETLYNLPTPSNTSSIMEEYITSAQMPTLTSEDKADLDTPITAEELELAISSTKPGKAPGLDGFTLQYYKTLLLTLSPHMVSFTMTWDRQRPSPETL